MKVQTTRDRDKSGYRPAPNALCAYERLARAKGIAQMVR
nr:hypothetical protein [Mucilaginibacter sp. FT3.2]